MTIRIRKVNGEKYKETLLSIRRATAPEDTHINDFSYGDWFLAFDDGYACAMTGIRKSITMPGYAYMTYTGVLQGWRGRGLQKRLIRVRERWARKNGCTGLITDTRPSAGPETVISGYNLQKLGFSVFWPKYPWGYQDTVYWIKRFDNGHPAEVHPANDATEH